MLLYEPGWDPIWHVLKHSYNAPLFFFFLTRLWSCFGFDVIELTQRSKVWLKVHITACVTFPIGEHRRFFVPRGFSFFFAWLKTTGKVWWLPVISVKTAWCLRCELMENLLIERGFKRKMCLTFVKHNGKKGWQSSRRAPADVKCYHWPQMMGLYFQPMPWIILLSLKAFSFFFTILLNKISLLSKWSYFIPTLTLFYVISG